MTPSQPERKAIVSRSENAQSRKITRRGEMAASNARRQPIAQSGSPPVAALVEPVSL